MFTIVMCRPYCVTSTLCNFIILMYEIQNKRHYILLYILFNLINIQINKRILKERINIPGLFIVTYTTKKRKENTRKNKESGYNYNQT